MKKQKGRKVTYIKYPSDLMYWMNRLDGTYRERLPTQLLDGTHKANMPLQLLSENYRNISTSDYCTTCLGVTEKKKKNEQKTG